MASTTLYMNCPPGSYSGQMAQYVPADVPFVMDFVDMDSAKFAAYADDAHGPMRWMMRREARLLGAFERQVSASVRASLFVSEAEAALFRSGGGAGRIVAVENGIDAAAFDPAGVDAATQGPLLVFTGQMDYRPNIDAVTRFVEHILPLVRKACPTVRFAIVGRAPPRWHIPRRILVPFAFAAEAMAGITGREPFLTRDGLRMAKYRMFFSSAKAERELGYRSRPYREGLVHAIDWFRKAGYLK